MGTKKSFFRNRYLLMAIIIIIALGLGMYFWQIRPIISTGEYKTPQESNIFVRFGMEAFDKILENYWAPKTVLSENNLAELFQLSLQKVASTSETLATNDRSGVAQMLAVALARVFANDGKRQLVIDTVGVALLNLQPPGRSALLSQKQEVAFRQVVSNINPSSDLYQNLGLSKGASVQEVNHAYESERMALGKATSTEAKNKLQEIAYAHEVLTNTDSKNLYDQAQIEPTVFTHIINKTLYLYISKISPTTTLQEFGRAVENASSTKGLDGMIIDLRGNFGGSPDFLTSFLGLFIGPNQYAFDLFHQGDYQVQRTSIGKFNELARYKEIAVLIDHATLSSAELIAATMRHFNLARLVGTTTGGWGTIENTYPLETIVDPNEKYALLLVNSITLRDDNQPIQGRGVDPDVDISNSNWKNKLGNYFHSPDFIQALRAKATQPPIR
jgi:hypothetical protein